MSHVSNLRIVARWADMYADWEEGLQCSPSTSDLVRVAASMWGVEVSEETSDAFFEYAQESTTLEEQIEWLAQRVDALHLPPTTERLTFDEVEAAGLDGSLRDM